MISNVVAAAVAGPASSPKGPSGHASEKAHTAFKEALDRTGNNNAQEDKPQARETGGKAHSVIADAHWRDAVQKIGEDGIKAPIGEDAETPPKPSGDDTDAAAGKESLDILHADRVTAGDTVSPDVSGDEGSEDASSRETGRDETDARDVRPDAAGVQNAGAAAVAQARPAAKADTRKEGDRDSLAAAKAAGNADTARAAAGSARAAVADGDEPAAIAVQAVVSEDRKNPGEGAPVVTPVAGGKARVGAAERPAGRVIPAWTSEPGTRGERGNAGEALSRAEERTPRPVPANATPSAETARPVTVVGAGQQSVANPETPAGRQVVAAVTRDIEDLLPSRLALTTGTSQGGTVKTMRLQLNPAELGVVHVRLQSVDGELRVTIRAESDKTAKMLSGDSDAIRSALRAVGIAAPDVSVATNRSDTAQQQAHNAPNREAPGQQFGSQENRGNTSNESRQNYRELASNDTARTPAHGNDAGDSGLRHDGRVTI